MFTASRSSIPPTASRFGVGRTNSQSPANPPDTAEAIDANFAWLQQSDVPKLILHATPGAILPPPALEQYMSVLSNVTTVDLGEGIHYLQEDHPHEIGEGIANWYRGL